MPCADKYKRFGRRKNSQGWVGILCGVVLRRGWKAFWKIASSARVGDDKMWDGCCMFNDGTRASQPTLLR